METKGRIERVYDLTDSQQAILARTLGDVPATTYVVQKSFVVRGRLDVGLAEQAAAALSRRHEILRASIYLSGEGLTKHVVLRDRSVEVLVEPLGDRPVEQAEAAQLLRGFDLQRDPLLRILFLADGSSVRRMVWTFHHIIIDGWSLGVLLNDFFEFYETLASGERRIAVAAAPSFGDHVEALRLKGTGAAEEFWRPRLATYDNGVAHPYARPEASADAAPDAVSRTLGRRAARQLARVVEETGLTVSTVLQFAWGLLLARERGVDDIVIGRVVSGRDSARRDFHEAVGMYVNTVPTRLTLFPDDTVLSAMQRMADLDGEARDLEHVPWSAVRREAVSGGLEMAALFVLENYYVREAGWQSGEATGYRIELVDRPEYSEFPLTLGVTAFEGYVFAFGYDSGLYTRARVERIAARYARLLSLLLADVSRSIREIDPLPPDEEREVLAFGRGPSRESSRISVAARLAYRINEHPERAALVNDDSRLTYGQLRDRLEGVADQLAAWDTPPGSRIVVVGESSIETVVGMLGVLWSGCSFVAVEASTHPARLATICAEAGAFGVLLATTRFPFAQPSPQNVAFVPGVATGSAPLVERKPRPRMRADPERELYAIFTSGSTGTPKGVPICEPGVLDLADTLRETVFPRSTAPTIGLVASVAFDASLQQIFGALLNGATLDIVPSGLKLDPEAFVAYLTTHRIDVIDGTPSLWQTMVPRLRANDREGALPSVFVIGGERMPGALVRDLSECVPGATVVNAYGLSETTVDSALHVCRRSDEDALDIPVGRPVAGTSLYVLDREHRPRGVGLIGDVYISGAAVTPGYLNAADRAISPIVSDPWTGARMIRTGDLGYWDDDGLLRIVGRSDNQVKVNGYRVELGEIEHALLAVEGVESAAVVDVEENGRVKLVAFVVADALPSPDAIRSALAETLPPYMVPSRYVAIDGVPMTVSGKVDKTALRLRLAAQARATAPVAESDLPADDVGRLLVEVVGKVLKRQDVTLASDFFTLGGDSIEAIRVVALLSDYSITVSEIVAHPVLGDLAARMRLRTRAIDQRPLVGAVGSFPIHRQMWRATAPDDFHHFNQSMVFEMSQRVDLEDLVHAGNALVNHHDALRASFSYGAEELVVREVDEAEPLIVEEQASESELSASIRTIQQSLSPATGRVIAMALLRTERRDCLAVVVHHAVCDAVSLRLIAEDLEALLAARLRGESAVLPKRTDSIRAWRDELLGANAAAHFETEESFWSAQLPPARVPSATAAGVPVAQTEVADTAAKGVSVTASFKDGLERSGLTLQAALTAAFADAYGRVYRRRGFSLLLEGHGRQRQGSDLNVTRTVGWFTAVHLLRMDTSRDRGLDLAFCADVRARLDAVPDGGVGYTWHYADTLPPERVAEVNATSPIFNYLGDFQSQREGALLAPLTDLPADDVAGSARMENPLIVNVSVTDGRLRTSVRHARGILSRRRVARLIRRFEDNLRRLETLVGSASFGNVVAASLSAMHGSPNEIATVINRNGANDLFVFPPAMLRVAYMPIYESLFAGMTDYRVHVVHLQPGPAPEERFAGYVRSVTGGERPFAFVGYSGGANLAYETAIRLAADGLDPFRMLFIDGFKWETGLDFAVVDEDTVDGLIEQFVASVGLTDQLVDAGELIQALESERRAFIDEGRRYREYAVSHQNREQILERTSIVHLLSEERPEGKAETRHSWQRVSRLPIETRQGTGDHLSMLANSHHMGENKAMITRVLDSWREESRDERPIVSATGLSRTFGVGGASVRALDGVDFALHAGEIVVVLGSSGSGKSTLLNTISTLDTPDEGHVEYLGTRVDFSDRRAVRNLRKAHVGFVFQAYNLVSALNVTDNILLGATSKESGDGLAELALGLGIDGLLTKFPTQLSGGEQQRVAIARALVKRPGVLFCDEPTGALDTRNSMAVLRLLCAYRDLQNTAIVLVTHNPQIAELADRVLTMRDGRIVSESRSSTPASVDEIAWV